MKQKNIFHMFQSQALLRKNDIAVSTQDLDITYGELLNSVNMLSMQLLRRLHPEKTKVSILLNPSIDFITTIMACLKIGVAYIPLNTSYPETHIQKILNDAEVRYLISDKLTCRINIQNLNMIYLDDLKSSSQNDSVCAPKVTPSDDAYIIYTSGSTGSPKGVVVTHHNLISLIKNTQEIYQIQKNDRIPLYHSLAFDFSVWEIFSALVNGATLVIPTEAERKSLDLYYHFLIKNEITILNMTPAVFYLLQEKFVGISTSYLPPLKLRLVILGGDALKPMRLKMWFNTNNNAELYNMYGITEGTIHSTYIKITSDMAETLDSTIGLPLPHVKIMVLDKNGDEITTPNMSGELCLMGDSVTKGYYNNPELTANKFFRSSDGKWCFRTGDIVKKRSDGNYEYQGRKDRQLKIRGFRADPLEIENMLLAVKGVSNAFVSLRFDELEKSELICFIEASDGLIDLMEIKKYLQKNVPEYMIPSRLIAIKNFPLNTNGKINVIELFKFLNIKEGSPPQSNGTCYISDAHKKIEFLWKNILMTEIINHDQNFFDAGGTSLSLMQLHFDIQKEISPNVTLINLIEYPTINKFVAFIKDKIV